MGRSILIAGYYGFGNLGDDAILAAIIDGLRRNIQEVEISVVGGNPKEIEDRNANVSAIEWRDLSKLIESARKADLLILGGGGIFHDYWNFDPNSILTSKYGSIDYYCSIPLLAYLLKKPCQIFAAGVGPLKTDIGQTFTRLAFELAQETSVRDPQSKQLLAAIGVQKLKEIRISHDPAILIDPAPSSHVRDFLQAQQVKEHPKYLAVNLRYWAFDVDPEAWPHELARALDLILAEEDYHILFIPFQAYERNPIENDLLLMLEIQEGMKHKQRSDILGDIPSPSMMLGIFRQCSAAITMRLHASIFAVSQGVPTLALAYDPKVAQWMEEVELKDFSLSSRNWYAETIYNAWKRVESTKHDHPGSSLQRFKDRIEDDFHRARDLATTGISPPSTFQEALLQEITLAKVQQLIGLTEQIANLDQTNLNLIHQLESERTQLAAKEKAMTDLITNLEQTSLNLAHQLENERAHLAAKEKAMTEVVSAHAQHVGELENRLTENEGRYQAAVNRVNEIESSRGWRFVRWLWRVRLSIAPHGSVLARFFFFILKTYAIWKEQGFRILLQRVRIRLKLGGTQRLFPHWWTSASDHDQHLERLQRFLDTQVGSESDQLVMITSAVPLVLAEGQRSMWLTREFASMNIPVIYAAWRWDVQELPSDFAADAKILQIPFDVLITKGEFVLGHEFRPQLKKLLLLEFPHPSLFRIVNLANANGWISVYDVIDDWEAFQRVGQAIWYDRKFEGYLAHNVDQITATAEALAKKMRELGATDVLHLGNAYEGETFGPSADKVDLPLGEITIGYFGHLTPSWFDWPALTLMAQRHPEWMFHLIGYGDEGITDLPNNILRLGKVPHDRLPAFSSDWDVAMIPFKPDELASAVDPVKVYEYLALGLPVVSQGMPHLEKIPCVRNAQTVDEMEALILEASINSCDRQAVSDFLSTNTWGNRCKTLLSLITDEARNRPWD